MLIGALSLWFQDLAGGRIRRFAKALPDFVSIHIDLIRHAHAEPGFFAFDRD
jgi:hypothetical protein